MKVIHLSDLHIGRSENYEKLILLADRIIQKFNDDNKPTIIITGDITDDGDIHQFRKVKKVIQELENTGFIVVPVPGNHDYGNNGIIEETSSQTAFSEYLGKNHRYPYEIKNGDHHIIIVDSMEAEMEKIDFIGAQGCIGRRQLNNLNAIIEEIKENSANAKITVALHHHPFYYKYFLALRDADNFKKVVGDITGKNQKIDCLLFGHKHASKRFADKEKKYNIPIIYASHKTTSYAKGTSESLVGMAVFRITLIDIVQEKVEHIELPS